MFREIEGGHGLELKLSSKNWPKPRGGQTHLGGDAPLNPPKNLHLYLEVIPQYE